MACCSARLDNWTINNKKDRGYYSTVFFILITSYEFPNSQRHYPTKGIFMSDSAPKIIFNPDGNGEGDACIPNISPAERKKRMDFGILQLVITFGILAAMLYFGADKLWRLPLFAMFSSGAVSIFQALDKT